MKLKGEKEMEQEYTIEFECRFRVKVKCKPEDLADTVSDLNIPEDDETKYVEDTFDLFSITDASGRGVDESGDSIDS